MAIPRWFVLAGFVHDLGKVLCLYGEPQWAVVGDTFPVGCAYSDEIVFPEFFAANPDSKVPEYQTKYGIYEPNCGLDNVHLSWGHDEYIYTVDTRLSSRARAIYAPLSFVLPRAQTRRIPALDERARRADVRMGAQVQADTICIRRAASVPR